MAAFDPNTIPLSDRLASRLGALAGEGLRRSPRARYAFTRALLALERRGVHTAGWALLALEIAAGGDHV